MLSQQRWRRALAVAIWFATMPSMLRALPERAVIVLHVHDGKTKRYAFPLDPVAMNQTNGLMMRDLGTS